ncbi:BTAD domain-containing putative transcriptional regulator [Amycolatopsis nigrescens]|uniref:BTAD domain-containing putative transcriptional regulator n=1 Tax=Amycolatopsis nigrescens TaxID=381445 RepID=UPI00037039D7|nr:BTAD domain-containing putative transcriptional regulator [Amycolatopsis nigrescens]
MRYGVLGPLVVWDSGGRQVKVPEAKVRALLANLLIHGGRPVPADRLIEDLWAGRPPGGSANALQTKVSQLRRVLGRERVVREPAGYRLLLDDDAIDAARFQELAERARASEEPTAKGGLFAEAMALWRGPAYADVAEAMFARGEVARLEELRLTVVEEQAEVRLELGEYSALATELGELVARQPLRERLRMVQMRALYRAGRQGEALHCFQDLRRRLSVELGVSPGPEVTALHEAMLRQEPGLAAPAGTRRPSCRTNLPTPLAALIGRQDAVDQLRATVSSAPDTRLVTLTGLGGVGKTRLATAAAGEMAGRFPDGVWLVELAGLGRASTQHAIAERVIEVMGLCDTAATEPDLTDLVGWLCQAVAEKSLLLVLDNCEHVVAAVAALADTFLARVPEARLLVTSQETLDIPGEVVRQVPPLALPDQTGPAGGDPAVVARSSAVELFVARAAAAVPGFTLDEGNARAVSAICRRLDGIPLALELVASRLRTLTPAQLAECLDHRFTLPTGRGGGRPERQQTLRGMLDWSWELLTAGERIVLRRLAVHVDGCTLESAEAVCAGDDLPAGQVADLLSRLVDRSLVVRQAGRFRLLESVAAYSAERLAEAGELGAVRESFVRCYTELAEESDERLRGPEQGRYLERLDAETVNLRRALEIAVGEHDEVGAEHVLRLVNAMAWYWFLRGRLTEARRSFHASLELDDSAFPASRAMARAWLAGIELRTAADRSYDYDELTAGIDDPGAQARAQWFLGTGLLGVGRDAEGQRLVEESLAVARANLDRWGEAAALVERVGYLRSRADAELGAALFQELGDRWGRLRATGSLALVAELDGDHARAERLRREGLLVAEELGLWTEVVETLTWLGQAALGENPARSEELYERARLISAERSYPCGEIRAETGLALAARQLGDRETARHHLNRAMAKSRTSGDEAGIADALAELNLVDPVRVPDPHGAGHAHRINGRNQ